MALVWEAENSLPQSTQTWVISSILALFFMDADRGTSFLIMDGMVWGSHELPIP